MPRQIDLFTQNFQVNHNPNNRLSFSSQQVGAMQNQLPSLIAQAEQEAITKILELIDQETGLDLVGLQQWLNQLSASLSQSWLNFQNLLNGIVQETDADVSQAIAYLNGIGEAANNAWTQLEDFFATGDWSDLSTAIQDILQSIFGSSTQWGLVNSIPAPAVVNVSQNIQPVFDFPDAQSVSGGSQWSWDGSHDHTGVTGSGSAKVVCNGVLQALRGIPGAVQPGQVVTATGWVMWSGLTYTGSNPIQLQLVPFSQSGSELVAGTPFEVAQLTSPASSGSWTQLTGTYTVPSSGVAAVQLRLMVGGNASAGSVWWDDCEANLTGGFLADLQADSNNIIDSFAPGGTSAQFVTGVTNLLALVGLTPASVGGATNLTALWTNIVNDFINPLNALEISAVNGLASALSALLGTTTFQSLLDSVANALGHSGTGHTITNIETYLGLIPPSNVTNVLGGANLGADVSSVNSTTTTHGGWFGRLTNDLTILLDFFHVTYTSTQWTNAWNDLMALFGATQNVTAPSNPTPTIGTVVSTTQSTLNTTNTNLFGSTTPAATVQVGALPTGIPAAKVANVLGGSSLSADLSNLSSWLYGTTTPTSATQVQSTAVQGAQGITNIAATIQNTWDNWANALATALGLSGVSGSNNSLSAVTGAVTSHAQQTASALSLGMTASNALASFTTSQPLAMGLSNTLIASTMSIFDIGSAANSALNINAGNSCIGFIQFGLASTIGSVAFLASSTSSGLLPSSLYCNIYSVNASSGTLTLLVSSGNLSGLVSVNSASGASNGAGWVLYNLSTPLSVAAGAVLAFEVLIPSGGSGVVNFYGKTATVPLYSAVFPTGVGAYRTTSTLGSFPASITASGYTYMTSAPWIGIDGPTETPYNFPVTTPFLSSGTYNVPTWAKYLDVIALGGGGGGGNGFAAGGGSGSATTVTSGSNSLTAAGGSGGSTGTSSASSYAIGGSPGSEVYLGVTYHGGTNVSPQQAGSSPGGGGGGGVNYGAATYGQAGSGGSFNAATWSVTGGPTVTITIGAGGGTTGGFGAGNGAGGEVWLVARQS